MKDEARSAYERGVPVTTIARGIGCSRGQVHRWLVGCPYVGFRLSLKAEEAMLRRGKWVHDRRRA